MSLPRKRARPRRREHPIQPGWATPLPPEPVDDPERSTPEYRRLVAETKALAGSRCEAHVDGCVGRGVDPHHVLPVSEGGAVIVPACWMRWLCRQCHARIHSAAGRDAAIERGLLAPTRRKHP